MKEKNPTKRRNVGKEKTMKLRKNVFVTGNEKV